MRRAVDAREHQRIGRARHAETSARHGNELRSRRQLGVRQHARHRLRIGDAPVQVDDVLEPAGLGADERLLIHHQPPRHERRTLVAPIAQRPRRALVAALHDQHVHVEPRPEPGLAVMRVRQRGALEDDRLAARGFQSRGHAHQLTRAGDVVNGGGAGLAEQPCHLFGREPGRGAGGTSDSVRDQQVHALGARTLESATGRRAVRRSARGEQRRQPGRGRAVVRRTVCGAHLTRRTSGRTAAAPAGAAAARRSAGGGG